MRASGILLHVSSLPSPYGIGTFGKDAYKFVDFLVASGTKFWQILPLGHTSFGDSPYQTFSSIAGNPYFIDLEFLAKEKYLHKTELNVLSTNEETVNYSNLYNHRYHILKNAFKKFNLTNKNYQIFLTNNNDWLLDYALFMALKHHFNERSFLDWPSDLKFRIPSVISHYQKILENEINFYCFLQFMFFKQWFALKEYANNKGVLIIGDIPIYMALDSVDVWTNPHLFALSTNLTPTYVAGVPPDDFSINGQVWGNPLYNWDYHKKTSYHWWIKRLDTANKMYDYTRIDHFIGFENYFNVPFCDLDAKQGFYSKGPSYDLFKVVKEKLGNVKIIAEDLGNVTPDVEELLKKTNFPGMKVFQFAFNDHNSRYHPINMTLNTVAYTGTHDNETTRSWFKNASTVVKKRVLDYCGGTSLNIVYNVIKETLKSQASIAIIPIADYLNLDNKARINSPSTIGNNWTWRLNKKQLSFKLANEIKKLNIVCYRWFDE